MERTTGIAIAIFIFIIVGLLEKGLQQSIPAPILIIIVILVVWIIFKMKTQILGHVEDPQEVSDKGRTDAIEPQNEIQNETLEQDNDDSIDEDVFHSKKSE